MFKVSGQQPLFPRVHQLVGTIKAFRRRHIRLTVRYQIRLYGGKRDSGAELIAVIGTLWSVDNQAFAERQRLACHYSTGYTGGDCII